MKLINLILIFLCMIFSPIIWVFLIIWTFGKELKVTWEEI